MIRHLTPPTGLSVGSRVLDLAPAGEGLTPFLRYLGFDAADGGSFAADRAGLSSLPAHAYDLILVRDPRICGADLCRGEALAATAHLLAALQPGGRIVMVVRQEATWADAPGGHLRSCFARHFAPFSGATQVCCFPDGWSRPQTWSWLCGRQPRSGWLTASLRIETTPVSPDAWRERADQEARFAAEPCCQWSRRQTVRTDAAPAFPLPRVA
jgi:hypothetical protein